MTDISRKMGRKCKACGETTWTVAKKRWKCRHCGVWGTIVLTRPIKPAKKVRLMKTGMDQYVKEKKIQGR